MPPLAVVVLGLPAAGIGMLIFTHVDALTGLGTFAVAILNLPPAAPKTIKEADHPMSEAAQGSDRAGTAAGSGVRSWINHGTEVVDGPSPSLVQQFVESGQPFWLDIENPTDEVIDRLATHLGLHPLAVEDSKQFGQQGKLQMYGNVAMMVGFGLDQQMRVPLEVHCYYTGKFLITLHRGASPALDALRHGALERPVLETDPVQALHRLVTALHMPVRKLALGLDERLDAIEQRVLNDARDDDLTEITAIRQQSATMRHALTPARDLAARMPLVLSLPGVTSDAQLYLEDLSEGLQRLVAEFSAVEERCITLLSLHASLSGNHLAVVSRRLAAVATTFLPISFLAGFWGQNFNVLTGSVEQGWTAFWILGVGLSVVSILVTTFIVTRRKWT